MQYLPLLLLVVMVVGLAVAIMVLSSLIGRKKVSSEKLAPYECGVPLRDSARKNFYVKFYLIAILFILFDVETIYLYPWAVLFRELRLFGVIEMGVFVLILLIGYVYIWKRGALEWD